MSDISCMEILDLEDHDKFDKFVVGRPWKRYGHSTSVVKDCIYVFGGADGNGEFFNEMFLFNTTREFWELPQARSKPEIVGRHFHSAVVVHEESDEPLIYIFGGKSNGYKQDHFFFNTKWNNFTLVEKKGTVPSPRFGHSCCIHKDRFFLFGGYDNNGFMKNDLYSFRIETSEWKKIGLENKIPIPKRYHHTGTLNGSNYVISCGLQSTGQVLSDVWSINLESLEARNIVSNSSKKGRHARYGHSTISIGGDIYHVGGRGKKKDGILEVSSVKTNGKWKKRSDTFQFSQEVRNRSYFTIVQVNSKIYYFGGQDIMTIPRPTLKKTTKMKKETKEEEKEEVEGEGEEETIIDPKKSKFPSDQSVLYMILSYLTTSDLCNISLVHPTWPPSQASQSDRVWTPLLDSLLTYPYYLNYESEVFEPIQKVMEELSSHKSRFSFLRKCKRNFHAFSRLSYCGSDRDKSLWMESLDKVVRAFDDPVNEWIRKEDPLRIVFVGEGNVGKTCLLVKMHSKEYPEEYIPTVYDNWRTNVDLGNQGLEVTVDFWDTAYNEDYDRLRFLGYQEVDLFCLGCSIDNPNSIAENKFQEKWIQDVTTGGTNHWGNCGAPICLLITKCDLLTSHDDEIIQNLRYPPLEVRLNQMRTQLDDPKIELQEGFTKLLRKVRKVSEMDDKIQFCIMNSAKEDINVLGEGKDGDDDLLLKTLVSIALAGRFIQKPDSNACSIQ